MEEASLKPRKRKRPPSSAFQTQGIFTRSRSELFVHRTRSGRGRPDRIHRGKLSNQSLGSPSKDDQPTWLHPTQLPNTRSSRPSIKDLRARRVFSPTTAVGECSPVKKHKITDDPDVNATPASSSSSDALVESQPTALLHASLSDNAMPAPWTPQTILSDALDESQPTKLGGPGTDDVSQGVGAGLKLHELGESPPMSSLSSSEELGESQPMAQTTVLSIGDTLGESEQTILACPDLAGMDHVSEGAGLNLDELDESQPNIPNLASSSYDGLGESQPMFTSSLSDELGESQTTLASSSLDELGESQPILASSSSDELGESQQTLATSLDELGESQPTLASSSSDELGESQQTVASSSSDELGESQPTLASSSSDELGESQPTLASSSSYELGGSQPALASSSSDELGESLPMAMGESQTIVMPRTILYEDATPAPSTPQTILSNGNGSGELQPMMEREPDSVEMDHVSEGAGLKLDDQNVSLICEEKGLESSPDEKCGNQADLDADIEYAWSDLSGMLYDLSGLMEFDGVGKIYSWADGSSEEFLQTARTLDFDLFHESIHRDDGSMLVGNASSDPDCVLHSLPTVTEGFCHTKMDEIIPTVSSLVASKDQNNEVSADASVVDSICQDISKEIEFNGTDKDDCMDEECTQTTFDSDMLQESQLADDGSILVGHDSSKPNCVLNSRASVTEGFCHAKMNGDIPATSSLATSNAQSNELPSDLNEKAKSNLPCVSREIEFNRTPHDSDFLCKSQLPDDGGNLLVLDSVNPDQVTDEMPGTTSSCESPIDAQDGFYQAKMEGSIPVKRRKGGLSSQSRLKLFRTPNSLSYKRLLPFLMDLAKETESSLEIQSCQDHEPATIAEAADKRAPLLFDSLLNKTNSDSCKVDLLSVKSCNDLMTPSKEKAKEMNPNVSQQKPHTVECRTLESSLEVIREVPRQSTHEDPPALHNNESVIPMDPDDETAPHPGQVKSENSYKLETNRNSMITHDSEFPSTSPSCIPVNNDAEDESSVRERKMELETINYSSKEWLKTRPLVGDRLYRDVDGGELDDSVVQNHPESLSYTSTMSENASNIEESCPPKEENAPSVNRPGLVPYSQLKLIQTPNSLAYKRMLPFLRDLKKENACLLDNHSSQEICEVELDKALEERPLTFLDSSSHDSRFGKQNAEKKASHFAEPSSSTSACSNFNSLERPTTEIPIHNHAENDASCDWLEEMLSVSCTESVLQFDQIMLENSYLEPGCEALASVHATEFPYNELSCSEIINEALQATREESGSDIQGPSGSFTESSEERNRPMYKLAIDGKPLQSVDEPQHSSQVDKLVPTERLDLPPTKGILKKCPRNCKGLCSCQNCASFRLHAEKANEFSRKQMKEAEEVAVGLMKELSCLRTVLEKSFSPETGIIGGQTLQIDQVRRFCRKALIAEELARKCLRKMTQDLNNHCTITASQRQRVRFADHIEEKHLPKSKMGG